MGRNKLREVFSNDPNAPIIKEIEKIQRQAEEEKWCITCKHYIPPNPHLTGFVTEIAECELGGIAEKTCNKYQRKRKQDEQTQEGRNAGDQQGDL